MNLDQVATPGAVTKTALTARNAANDVKDHLTAIGMAPLFGLAGAFITGSNVWRTVYGLPNSQDSDVDVLVQGDNEDAVTLRGDVIKALSLTEGGVLTGPSMSEARDVATLAGMKFLTPAGRTVDIWGMADAHLAMQQYPEHSHASSRMAWDCGYGCLVMFPNSAANEVVVPVEQNHDTCAWADLLTTVEKMS